MIWFEPRNLQRPLVISHFDGTIFDVIAPKHTEAFSFGIPKKNVIKNMEKYKMKKLLLMLTAIFCSHCVAFADHHGKENGSKDVEGSHKYSSQNV
jgi:hypothetical protein